MRRQGITARLASILALSISLTSGAQALAVKVLVPTLGGSVNLGTNVSTILALRLWTTLRPRPFPNPDNLDFGVGQVEWSRRILDQSPEDSLAEAKRTGSDLALWGSVEEYGRGVVVLSNLIVDKAPVEPEPPRTWTIGGRAGRLALDLPSSSYQFSPLILSEEVVSTYSRPDRIRVCPSKTRTCDGVSLGTRYRVIRLDDDFVLVRLTGGAVGWAFLPNMSEAQGEVVDFTAALISYLRGDFEQAESFFTRVRDSKAESLVRNDASILAGISRFRRLGRIDELEAAHLANPYSQYGVQALVMARIGLAMSLGTQAQRRIHVSEASSLIQRYRHLLAPGDPWMQVAERLVSEIEP